MRPGTRPTRLARLTRRQRGQALVEAPVAFLLLLIAAVAILQFSLWMHARGVVLAAVQDGARVASSETGRLPDGVATARSLLRVGLGANASLVTVGADEDAAAVHVTADGHLPALLPWGPVTTLPLHASASMARDQFRP